MNQFQSFLIPVEGKLHFFRENTRFKPDYSRSNQAEVLEVIKNQRQMQLFNGACMRINHVDQVDGDFNVYISPVGFYDYVTTNVLYQDRGMYLLQALDDGAVQVANYLQDLTKKISQEFKPTSFFSALANPLFANPTAVSVLLTDSKGKVGVTQRGSSVAVNPNVYSVTATGMVDADDFKSETPYLAAAYRELDEELGIKQSQVTLNYTAWIISSDDWQPCMLVEGTFTGSLDQLLDKGQEFSLENDGFLVLTPDEIRQLLDYPENQMTPTTRNQLEHYLNKLG